MEEKSIEGDGIFPYIIVNQMPSVFIQIPIVFRANPIENKSGFFTINNKLATSEEELKSLPKEKKLYFFLEATKIVAKHFNKPTCLVLNENEAHYYKLENDTFEISEIPYGGFLLTMGMDILSFTKKNHYNLKSDSLSLTEKNQKEIDRQNFTKKHQQMLSAIVTKGFDNLSEEEKSYWNSVY